MTEESTWKLEAKPGGFFILYSPTNDPVFVISLETLQMLANMFLDAVNDFEEDWNDDD